MVVPSPTCHGDPATGVAPLVLDDPVNSLDYKRLDGVIDRVVAHV